MANNIPCTPRIVCGAVESAEQTAKKRSIVVQSVCPGIPRVLAQVHESHRMWSLGESDLFYCSVCGRRARRQVKDLTARCSRPAAAGARALKMVRSGVDPTSRKEVEVPFSMR
eukprot:4804089-Pyramimonas_sp.AAC.1